MPTVASRKFICPKMYFTIVKFLFFIISLGLSTHMRPLLLSLCCLSGSDYLWATRNVPAVNILTMTHKSWTRDNGQPGQACLMPTSWTDSWQDECRQSDENPNFIFSPSTLQANLSTLYPSLSLLLLLCYCLSCCFSGTFISYSKIVESEVEQEKL